MRVTDAPAGKRWPTGEHAASPTRPSVFTRLAAVVAATAVAAAVAATVAAAAWKQSHACLLSSKFVNVKEPSCYIDDRQ